MITGSFAARITAILAMALVTPAFAQSRNVIIFAAGSLRGVVADLSTAVLQDSGIKVTAVFGGSGLMRERIEHGEKADLLMSADFASPRQLQAQGRTALPPFAFARNRMCVVSRRIDAVTPANLIDRLLDGSTRIRTSTPIADPSGDYAWSIFERIDAARPGSGERLKAKARAMMDVTATPATSSQSAAAALFAAGRIDLSITYCSAAAALVRELPDLASLEVPAPLDPGPVYAAAVISDRPEVLRVALFLLSEKGQAILARNGLLPLSDPGSR